MSFLDRPEGRLAVALGIGLVIGAERERRKGEGPRRLPAGIRTFALVALTGGVILLLGNAILLSVGAAMVGAVALVAYLIGDRSDPGLTTEVALFLTYCLGALAVQNPTLALACGLSVATLLAFRASLHAAVRSLLSEEELRDALLLGVAAVVILPLLPNHAIDSLGVVNPFRLWRLVVVFMGMSAFGYLAQRAIGPRYGLALAGFGSGFVSSAATIAAMGARVRADASVRDPAIAGAAASTVATLIQLALLVGAADPQLLAQLAWPLGAGGVIALVYAGLQTWRAHSVGVAIERGHAFRISTALAFSALVTGVSLVSTLAMRWAGRGGLLVTAGIAGFADTHSAAAAVASVAAGGQVPMAVAEIGVLLAFTANTLTKCALALGSSRGVFSGRIILGLTLVLCAVWGAFTVQTLW